MATYKILYWQEIPSQVKAEDESGDASVPMPPRFMERIDRMAGERGLQDADGYLAQWRWSDEKDRNGSAQDVAEAVVKELETQAGF